VSALIVGMPMSVCTSATVWPTFTSSKGTAGAGAVTTKVLGSGVGAGVACSGVALGCVGVAVACTGVAGGGVAWTTGCGFAPGRSIHPTFPSSNRTWTMLCGEMVHRSVTLSPVTAKSGMPRSACTSATVWPIFTSSGCFSTCASEDQDVTTISANSLAANVVRVALIPPIEAPHHFGHKEYPELPVLPSSKVNLAMAARHSPVLLDFLGGKDHEP